MIPEPGSCSSDAASQASRSAWRFSRSALEGEAVATERAAERGELGAELLADVGDDPVVGGGGAPEHRHGGGVEAVDDLADPPVVGPEVVTPVGDAVDLVDDHQPGSRTDQRHRQVGELRVGEPLGRHEDEVDVVRRDVGGELVDRRRRRAVHRHRPQPEPGGGVDLVAHQREQRRDEQRRPEPGVAQQPGGEEVHGALAPSGALHDEDTGPVAHERLDGLTLMRPELRVGSPGQPTQGVEQFVGLTRLTHSGPLCRRGVSTAPAIVLRRGRPAADSCGSCASSQEMTSSRWRIRRRRRAACCRCRVDALAAVPTVGIVHRLTFRWAPPAASGSAR